MTASDWNKITKQLKRKPAKLAKFLKNCKPKERTTGVARYKCENCGRFGAHLSQYNLNICRQCFRDIATQIGFKKYN